MKNRKMDKKGPVQAKKLDLSVLRRAEKYTVDFCDIDQMVDAEFVKKLRDKLNMSQSFFAQVLGVSKKTVEKWEQSVNPMIGTASRMLYIIDKYPALINEFYTDTYSSNVKVFKKSAFFDTNFNIVVKAESLCTVKPNQKEDETYCPGIPAA
ncbi:MAG TPA: helix-turn-helix domain-containing protein [Acholeplasmataceae bacterium]|nr:helix-turn-helix domain-containing protein [Acholeplasmataceae bacterium]